MRSAGRSSRRRQGHDDARQAEYRRARWEALRARVELSQLLRKIEFTENIKRRLIDQIKESVEGVMRLKREVDQIERQLNKNKKIRLKEDDRKNLLGGRRTSSCR